MYNYVDLSALYRTARGPVFSNKSPCIATRDTLHYHYVKIRMVAGPLSVLYVVRLKFYPYLCGLVSSETLRIEECC
jgi:hypothetical protein